MKPKKFRAWSKKFHAMNYQGDADLETLQSFMFHYGDSKDLMEFTGVVDKNNNSVFEGDLLGGIYENCVVEWCKECKQFELFMINNDEKKVECLGCMGEFQWKEFTEEDNQDKIEVIGNVYEGELL